jgi:hypothetical protein
MIPERMVLVGTATFADRGDSSCNFVEVEIITAVKFKTDFISE